MKSASRALVVLCAAALLLLPLIAAAEEAPNIRGHLKYQGSGVFVDEESIAGMLGPDNSFLHELDARAAYSLRRGDFDFDAAAEMLAVGSGALDTRRTLLERASFVDSSLLTDDSRRLLDLTVELFDEKDAAAAVRIDRASVRWSSESLVLRAGRQTISWGNGLAFSVLDLFNPFSPAEIDRDYKTGDDILYGQWLSADGSDLQALSVFRRNPYSEAVAADESSFALKWRQRIAFAEIDAEALIARHFDENLGGVSLARELYDGVIRFDATLTELQSGSKRVSFLVNYDRSWVIFDKNVYGFVEYFRSGFGSGDGSYTSLEPELIDRIARGELFTLGRDYLLPGVQIELTPLLRSTSSVIFNLHDESGFIQQRFEFDLLQDLTLASGVNLLFGPLGSEFGGFEPAAGQGTFAPADSAYVRLSYYY